MTRPYERKKNPAGVKRALLDSAAQLANQHGMGAVTIDAVARAAGVTKGGLFHHFPNKNALIYEMFADQMAHLDASIDAAMATDPVAHGRFTRAYIGVTFAEHKSGDHNQWATLSLSMLADPLLQVEWAKWAAARLARHADTDSDPRCALARHAANGVWLSMISSGSEPLPDLTQVRLGMLDLTRPLP